MAGQSIRYCTATTAPRKTKLDDPSSVPCTENYCRHIHKPARTHICTGYLHSLYYTHGKNGDETDSCAGDGVGGRDGGGGCGRITVGKKSKSRFINGHS